MMAPSYLKQMQKHQWLYKVTMPFIKAFLHESAVRVGFEKRRGILGYLIASVGIPFCAMVGRFSSTPVYYFQGA